MLCVHVFRSRRSHAHFRNTNVFRGAFATLYFNLASTSLSLGLQHRCLWEKNTASLSITSIRAAVPSLATTSRSWFDMDLIGDQHSDSIFFLTTQNIRINRTENCMQSNNQAGYLIAGEYDAFMIEIPEHMTNDKSYPILWNASKTPCLNLVNPGAAQKVRMATIVHSERSRNVWQMYNMVKKES